MRTRSVAVHRDRGPGRVRIVLAAAWMVLSLALGGLVTAEARQANDSGTVAVDSLP